MRSVYVTINAQVFIDEDDLDTIKEQNNVGEQEAVQIYAMAKVGEVITTDNPLKERGITVRLDTLA